MLKVEKKHMDGVLKFIKWRSVTNIKRVNSNPEVITNEKAIINMSEVVEAHKNKKSAVKNGITNGPLKYRRTTMTKRYRRSWSTEY